MAEKTNLSDNSDDQGVSGGPKNSSASSAPKGASKFSSSQLPFHLGFGIAKRSLVLGWHPRQGWSKLQPAICTRRPDLAEGRFCQGS